jgi:hypothetical protein
VPWTAPNLKVLAVQHLLCFRDCLLIAFADQRLEADKVTVIPDNINSIFWHRDWFLEGIVNTIPRGFRPKVDSSFELKGPQALSLCGPGWASKIMKSRRFPPPQPPER